MDPNNLVLEAYKAISEKDNRPELEAIWGYYLALTKNKRGLTKTQVKDSLDQEQLMYFLNGDPITPPQQEVW